MRYHHFLYVCFFGDISVTFLNLSHAFLRNESYVSYDTPAQIITIKIIFKNKNYYRAGPLSLELLMLKGCSYTLYNHFTLPIKRYVIKTCLVYSIQFTLSVIEIIRKAFFLNTYSTKKPFVLFDFEPCCKMYSNLKEKISSI